MLASRTYQSPAPPLRRTPIDEKRDGGDRRTSPMRGGQSLLVEKQKQKQQQPAIKDAPTTTTTSPTAAEPSRPTTPPVSIPRATGDGGRRRSAPGAPAGRIPQVKSQSVTSLGTSSRTLARHDPRALSPSVAALLAVTQIPPRKPHANRKRVSMGNRRVSIDELVAEWNMDDISTASTPPSGSPLSVLLEPLDEADASESSSLMEDPEMDRRSQAARSISSDSVPGLSLGEASPDDLSSNLWAGSLPLQRTVSNGSPRLRPKMSLSPPLYSEECLTTHPLLANSPMPSPLDEIVDPSHLLLETTTLRLSPSLSSTFKSNLTASLTALKNAAKSISSNFNVAPSLPPDDHLTRSIIFPRFTNEMRPRAIDGAPSPALRRYLNPDGFSPHSSSSAVVVGTQDHPLNPLHWFSHSTFSAEDPDLPAVQLETYIHPVRRPSVNPSPTGTSRSRSTPNLPSSTPHRNNVPARPPPSPNSEAGRVVHNASSPSDGTSSPSGGSVLRQREPRENSAFLRIVVLEMNMRRRGKLDPAAPGRARIWLPPRRNDVVSEVEAIDGEVEASAPASTSPHPAPLARSHSDSDIDRVKASKAEKKVVPVVPVRWRGWGVE